MKLPSIALLFLVALAVSVPTSAAAKAPVLGFARIPGTVVNVVDGDTCDVEFRFVVRVRLLAGDQGCWTDESHLQGSIKDLAERKASRDRGLAAAKSLRDKAVGKPCFVEFELKSNRMIDYLTMERLLANVESDGDNLGLYQVSEGHASTRKGGPLGE